VAGSFAAAAATALALWSLAGSVHARVAHGPAQAAGAAASYGPEPPLSLFGLDTGVYDRDVSRLERDTPMAAAMGAKWVHFTGDSIVFHGNSVSFAGLDAAIDQARSYHLGVLVSLGGVPAACSLTPRPADVSRCPPTSPADLRAYSTYLRTLLLHLRGRVDYFESWVEPNHASMWQPKPDAEAYARLLVREYQTFQAVNRQYGMHDKLLFAGIGGSDLGYLAAVLDALGGRRAFDLVGDAPFRFPPTPPSTPNYAISFPGGGHPKLTWVQELTDYEGEFTSHGYGQPKMWLTEFGWPGTPAGAQTANVPIGPCGDDEHGQDDIVKLAYRILETLRRKFVEGADWFNIRNYQKKDPTPEPKCFKYYGLLATNFEPKPAAVTFEELAGKAEAAGPSGPAPTLGSTAGAVAVSGAVAVEAPGTSQFVPLVGARPILFGSTVDATNGTVRITAATTTGTAQSAIFYGGQFRIEQSPSGAVTLILNAPLDCRARAPLLAAAPGKPSRHRTMRSLWGNGHGNFTTAGSYASATVLGTKWLTQDTCTTTRIVVALGKVRVRDFVRQRSVILVAPHSYVAKQ